MRSVLLVVLLLPSVSGFELTDPAGDLRHFWAGQEATLIESPHADLVALRITQTEDAFAFELELAGEDPETYVHDYYGFLIWLMHGQQQYRIVIGQVHTVPLVPTGAFHYSVSKVSDGAFHRVLGGSIEPQEQFFRLSLPREAFLDEFGAPPRLGQAFEEVYVTVSGGVVIAPGVFQEPVWRRSDRMPDDGFGRMPFAYGLAQTGAVLASAEPYRASNGEAGAFAFNVTLTAEVAGEYTLAVSDVPAQWVVRVPFSSAALMSGEKAEFAVTATVPFAHAHGTTEAFTLVARAPGAEAQIRLGIHYVDPPQPSGHHPKLWIHAMDFGGDHSLDPLQSRETIYWPFMNAAKDDPADAGGPITPSGSVALTDADGARAAWGVPLVPGLRMGLNVTEADAPVLLRFDNPVAHETATLSGNLTVWTPNGPVQVAQLIAPDQALPAGVVEWEAVLRGAPQIIEYQRGQGLVFEVRIHIPGPAAAGRWWVPYLLPGSEIGLPLAEYEESIADASGFVQAPSAAVVESHEAEPGRDSPGSAWVALAALALGLKRRIT